MQQPFCLIMLGGDAPAGLARQALPQLAAQAALLVAADSGADHLLAAGLMPQLVVGDNDSLSAQSLRCLQAAKVEIRALPREKDLTDGEAALQAALAAGYRRLTVFGALGGGLDHQLGNLLLPLAYRESWDSCVFYGEDCTASYCFGASTVEGSSGDTVSLVPLSATVEGLSLRGFRYPLQDHTVALGSSLCLRNQLSGLTGSISLSSGILLVIHHDDNTGILDKGAC